MNKWLFLLLVVGLAGAGWVNREKINAWMKSKPTEAEVEIKEGAPATPNPAADSIAQARKAYPALAMQGSPFNIKFVQNYNALKISDPNFLAKADWPMRLAERTAHELTVDGPVAGGPPPSAVSGSQLNARPPGSSPGYTVPPSVKLPGLQGSSLDQRPPKRGLPP